MLKAIGYRLLAALLSAVVFAVIIIGALLADVCTTSGPHRSGGLPAS